MTAGTAHVVGDASGFCLCLRVASGGTALLLSDRRADEHTNRNHYRRRGNHQSVHGVLPRKKLSDMRFGGMVAHALPHLRLTIAELIDD